jgi:hypothetical protein
MFEPGDLKLAENLQLPSKFELSFEYITRISNLISQRRSSSIRPASAPQSTHGRARTWLRDACAGSSLTAPREGRCEWRAPSRKISYCGKWHVFSVVLDEARKRVGRYDCVVFFRLLYVPTCGSAQPMCRW